MMTCFCVCFFYNDTATTDIYTYGITLSLHDALPIYARDRIARGRCPGRDFDQQRVVVRRDDCAAVSRAAVETNAETGRTAIREQATVVRREAVFRLLGGDAALQRVTIEAHLILRRQRGGGALSGVAVERGRASGRERVCQSG